MKLLTVHMTLDVAAGGGNAARALQLGQSLTALGVECAVAAGRDGLQNLDPAELRGIEVIGLPTLGRRHPVPRGGFAPLWRAVRRADVVLLMNHWTAINAVAFVMARRAKRPHVICPGGALIHHGRSRLRKRVYNTLIGRRMVRTAAAHIATTEEERGDWHEYGVDPAAVTVIPNGLPRAPRAGDAAAFRLAHGLGQSPLLLFLGRLAPIKGPDLLLEAFAMSSQELAGWQLVFAGPDGGLEAELREVARAAGVGPRVHFVGFLDGGPKQDALAAAELLVLPSRRETMSIVVLEAAAAQRAVLVTDRCGLGEVEAVAGGWVVPATARDLADGLAQATRSREERRRRALAWSRHVQERYAWPRIAAALLEVFRRVAVPE